MPKYSESWQTWIKSNYWYLKVIHHYSVFNIGIKRTKLLLLFQFTFFAHLLQWLNFGVRRNYILNQSLSQVVRKAVLEFLRAENVLWRTLKLWFCCVLCSGYHVEEKNRWAVHYQRRTSYGGTPSIVLEYSRWASKKIEYGSRLFYWLLDTKFPVLNPLQYSSKWAC